MDHREQQIAALIREHMPVQDANGWECEGPRTLTHFDTFAEWAQHLAHVLAVQLSEERPSLYGVSFEDFVGFVRAEFMKRWRYETTPELLDTLRAAVLAAIGPNAVRSVDSLRPPDDLEAIRSDEAVRDAFVECYTEHSIFDQEPEESPEPLTDETLARMDEIERELIRVILRRGADSVAAPEETKHE